MKNFILGAAAGYLFARYFIFSMDRQEYLKKEAEAIDKFKNNVHDLLERVTDLTNEEIVKNVEEAISKDDPIITDNPVIAKEMQR